MRVKFNIVNLRQKSSKGPDEEIPETMKRIRERYKSQIQKISRLVLPDLNTTVFCKTPSDSRFSWMQNFIC